MIEDECSNIIGEKKIKIVTNIDDVSLIPDFIKKI